MKDDDFDARHAHRTAHIGYALVSALLNELEKEAPELRNRGWERALHSLEEYDLFDDDSADWVRQKIANL